MTEILVRIILVSMFRKQILKKAILRIISGAAFLSLFLFAASASASSAISTDVLNVRSGPGTDYARVKQLNAGATVNVLETKNGWNRIGTDQWVSGAYLKTSSVSTASSATAESTFSAITTAVLNVRSGPATSYSRVKQLTAGAKVTVLEVKNDWYRIGTNQWVIGDYLKKSSPTKAVSKSFTAHATAVLNVRSGAGLGHKIVKTLEKGKLVTVYEQSNGWDRIGTNQWVLGKYVAKGTVTAAPAKSVKSASSAAPTLPSAAVSTSLSSSCLAAIRSANSYCKSVASGCPSSSKTPHCIEVNKQCEAKQEAALSLCPVK